MTPRRVVCSRAIAALVLAVGIVALPAAAAAQSSVATRTPVTPDSSGATRTPTTPDSSLATRTPTAPHGSVAALTASPAQTARISEETRTLATYPFSEPDPVPILARDARLYPYHSFEGYSATSEPREWKVVKLENDYIEVYVLPEVGGKVWGAVVKETGHEFIYRNEVMKFRNIALRGPWTSGGIEFNFGVIGHSPATATPVDYLLRENADGSVSCIVGAMDLPSRTQWRVEIRLQPDVAYFETNALWFNPTPLTQPYYNWMTAAAFARDDLEMYIPGDAYLEHSGRVRDWPVDAQGRYLALYDNNRFDGSKSYHVVGELNDFFGGYYHDEDWGFGHWARYEDMPGQKLWLWALSREGGIWEDLLTDTDGQYIEFQAGRLLVQYSPGAAVNPITQAGFDPLSASRWSETWFPLAGIGGISDASRYGALHAVHDGDELTVSVNAFAAVDDTLEILVQDEVVAAVPLRLQPLGRYRTTMSLPAGTSYRVRVPALDLDYESDPAARRLERPFASDPEAAPLIPEVDRMVFEAGELYKGRRYPEARALFERAITREPYNRDALLGLAELDYRAGLYDAGLERASRALQLDAYDAQGNFVAGTLYRALGRSADARDAFGWAARSTAYRAAAYTELAEIMIGAGDLPAAEDYARRAIDFDRHGIPAWRVLAIVGRLRGDEALASEAQSELLAVDPLHHFVFAERYLGTRALEDARELVARLGGEYPDQTVIELAMDYLGLGRDEDALALFEMPESGAPMLVAWRAFLHDDPALLADVGDAALAFPFRRETLAVLQWADEHSDAWLWTYLSALNLWALDRPTEAAELFRSLGELPDFAPFYVARAQLLEHVGRANLSAAGAGSAPVNASAAAQGPGITADYRRAVDLDPDARVLHVHLVRHLLAVGLWDEARSASAAARERFPDDFNLALLQADALINLGRAAEALAILEDVQVLPSENARTSHQLWQRAHVMAGLDAFEAGDYGQAAAHAQAAMEWPESLGQGRPYDPEERLPRYVLARIEEASGDAEAARRDYEAVISASGRVTTPSRLDLLLIGALPKLRPDELDALLDRDLGRTEVALAWRRLAQAVSGGTLESIRPRLAAMAADYPAVFRDVDGRLILRALTATGGGQ